MVKLVQLRRVVGSTYKVRERPTMLQVHAALVAAMGVDDSADNVDPTTTMKINENWIDAYYSQIFHSELASLLKLDCTDDELWPLSSPISVVFCNAATSARCTSTIVGRSRDSNRQQVCATLPTAPPNRIVFFYYFILLPKKNCFRW